MTLFTMLAALTLFLAATGFSAVRVARQLAPLARRDRRESAATQNVFGSGRS